MEHVADRVGLKRASLVHYFPNKQALYEAVLDDLFGDLLHRYEEALAGPGSMAERYLRCVDVWVDQVESRPGLLRISMWEMARATTDEAVPLASRVQPLVLLLSEAIRAGQREGVFRDADPVGFVMSVAGTTAFLGLRAELLSPVAAALPAGGLKAELRSWVARVLFVDEAAAVEAQRPRAVR
jgi:TetR/AcrR family transcriptional regulator